MLAQKWFYGLMTRPDMSIKVERKLHDMRILGRIVGVQSTEQSAGSKARAFDPGINLYIERKGTNIMAQNPVVTITMENGDVITAELYPDVAPVSVNNFISLIKKGFYDGLIFHRVIRGFMIQGGDPEGTGRGGSDETIKGEFSENGVKNDISHERGVISMARSSDPDSASSQFFIVHEDSTFLDGEYACFGYVTDGMDVVDAICEDTKVEDNNGTVAKENQPVIESIKVID